MAYVRRQIRGGRAYYYLVESEREGQKVRQRVLRYLGTSRPAQEDINRIINDIQTVNDKWYNKIQQQDQGLGHGHKKWFDPEYDASAWPVMDVPAFWEDEGLKGLNGVVWFKKEIDIPVSMTGKKARIFSSGLIALF